MFAAINLTKKTTANQLGSSGIYRILTAVQPFTMTVHYLTATPPVLCLTVIVNINCNSDLLLITAGHFIFHSVSNYWRL